MKLSGGDLIGIGVVLLSALLVGMAPNAAKLAYQEDANPQAVIVFRTLIGAAGIALYLSVRRQWPENGRDAFRRSRMPGAAQALTIIGFIGAVAFIDISLAALIFYFHPFLVAVASHFRGGMSLNATLILCIALAIAGLALVFGVTFTTLSAAGIGLSLLGAIAAAAMILMVSDVSKRVGPIAANFYMTFWSSVFVLAGAVGGSMTGLLGEMALPTSSLGWIAIVGAGLTTTTGYVLFFIGVETIGMTRAVMWSVMEPIFAILFAIMLFSEWLSPMQWVGVAVVIGSLLKFERSSASPS